MIVAIYEGSTMIAKTSDLESDKAWKEARAYVRSMAHGAGQSYPARWERPKGRFSYSVGNFRAISFKRLPMP